MDRRTVERTQVASAHAIPFCGGHTVIRDLRYAFRSIARMPLLSTVVVLSLGVGIGVNTAVFSWLQAMVCKPLPGVRDVASIPPLEPRAETGSYPGASWPEYLDV